MMCAHCGDRLQERDLPKADGATIWDSDEMGLRFVLEEGKLSLIVRIAINHAVWISAVLYGTPSGIATASAEAVEALASVERGALGVLSNAWLHEEALQTLEPALVIELLVASMAACSAVGRALDDAKASSGGEAAAASVDAGSGATPDCTEAAASAASRAGDGRVKSASLPLPEAELAACCRGAGRMGALCLRLLQRLGGKLERLPESRLLEELLRFGLVRALAEHLAVNGAALPAEAVAEGLHGMSMLVAGEEIGGARAELLADPEARRLLVSVAEPGGAIAEACKDAAVKRRLRPLLDLVRAARRVK